MGGFAQLRRAPVGFRRRLEDSAGLAVLDCDRFSPVVTLELYSADGQMVERKRFGTTNS
jgi:hypothetical protein